MAELAQQLVLALQQASGKPEDSPSFINDLSQRAQFCRWDSTQHGILTVGMHNLLTDYGAITKANMTKANMTKAQTARAEGTHHSHQNTLMTYQCFYASLTDGVKMQLVG